jgi:D-lyxose ketol-isomerase
MITRSAYEGFQQVICGRFRRAGLFITEEEKFRIEIADFGLGRFEEIGLGILVYVNTGRCCAKELAMGPHQTCPEHLHPPVGSEPGKEETFRCRWGKVYLYVDGERASAPIGKPPKGREATFTVWHEVELDAGGQYTILPGTKHWFQAGPEGAVISEFSTRSTDECDLFTDPEIQRSTKIA